jgi:hypothetical protein
MPSPGRAAGRTCLKTKGSAMAEPREAPLSKSDFASAFADLQPAILAEWPQLDAATLAATQGDLERAVGLIAEQTAHTKALVRRQLEELHRVVCAPPPPRPRPASPRRDRVHEDGSVTESVDAMLHDLEQRAAHLLRDLRGGMLNDARGKVRENVLFSLVIALGFGFIVGVLFTGWGRGK